MSRIAVFVCCAAILTSRAADATDAKDRSQYVGYNASSGLPVILSAPHGGSVYPDSIPDRDAGCWDNTTQRCVWSHDCGPNKNISKCRAITVNDDFTQTMTGELRSALCALFAGLCPASVYNLLGRTKFDANRDRDEGTFGVPAAVDAFAAYHAVVDGEMAAMGGVGLFLDIHGHMGAKTELGYLVRGNVLDSGDPVDPNSTSIRSLAHTAGVDFDRLLRGSESFGGMLAEFGFDCVPSPRYPGPGNVRYFSGGYNSRRHGSVAGGAFDAVQIESARAFRAPEVRPRYVRALACTIKRFYCLHYMRISTAHHGVNGSAVGVQRSLADVCAAAQKDDACETSGAPRVNCADNMRSVCLTAIITAFVYMSDTLKTHVFM